ncbi:hypothetical protein [Pseudomonas profundi]|uniref:hypothetical protein n=1 Tax=Pseudomonas profundi TaxID=1981513 RepID=UPI00123867C5|nr:hypothetical protein [Pseudomonas profundi]
MEFKVVVDTLASLAALIAIMSVMGGWYDSRRKPLSIPRVVVHKKDKGLTFILVTRNRKSYPVATKRIDCFSQKYFEVEQRVGGKPMYAERLSSRNSVFMVKQESEVPAKGNIDLRIEILGEKKIPAQLIFTIETSHGYHELRCNDITVVEIGRAEVYSVDFKKEYNSRIAAKAVYYWKRVSELTIRRVRRLGRG